MPSGGSLRHLPKMDFSHGFNENQGIEKKKKLFHTPSCSVLKTEKTKLQTVCCVAKRLVPEEAVQIKPSFFIQTRFC